MSSNRLILLREKKNLFKKKFKIHSTQWATRRSVCPPSVTEPFEQNGSMIRHRIRLKINSILFRSFRRTSVFLLLRQFSFSSLISINIAATIHNDHEKILWIVSKIGPTVDCMNELLDWLNWAHAKKTIICRIKRQLVIVQDASQMIHQPQQPAEVRWLHQLWIGFVIIWAPSHRTINH